MQALIQACLSCLGLHKDEPDVDETSRLLDQQDMQYGATDSHIPTYVDPEEQRKQREALAKLQQDTAERLINIVPPTYRSGMDMFASRDGPLFEQVFFGDVDWKEVKRQYRELGPLDIEKAKKINLPDLSHQPLIYEFNWHLST